MAIDGPVLMAVAAASSRGHTAESFYVDRDRKVHFGHPMSGWLTRVMTTGSAPEIPQLHNWYYEIPCQPSSAFTEQPEVYT